MAFKVRSVLLVAMVSAALTGCSPPTDTVIPSDTSTWDTQLAPALKKLDDSDRVLATGYLMRVKVGQVVGGQGVPIGTTVGQAIENQKKWLADRAAAEAQEKALKEKLQQERELAAAKISKAVTVSLLELSHRYKDYNVGRYSDEQVVRIGVKNTSDTALAGVSGGVEFIDIFDKPIGRVGFSITETIKPGQDYVWTGTRHYNEFIAEQKAVWNLEDGKYKTVFKPEMLVYANGTKLVAEDE